MGITELNSSFPMPPEDSSFSPGSTNNPEAQSNNSIFASFNDSDNKVDVNDVVYNNNAKEDTTITKFLSKHATEDWTDALKQKIDFYIEEFNRRISNSRNSQSAEAQNNSFKKRVVSEFNSTDARNKAEADAFKQTSEGKVLELNNSNKNLTKEFKVKSMTAVLEDLENGYSGAIVVDKGSIIIKYDNDKKSFVLKKDGIEQTFDKENLPQIMSVIADGATSIAGKSKKVVLK